jgi:hypothetical protein
MAITAYIRRGRRVSLRLRLCKVLLNCTPSHRRDVITGVVAPTVDDEIDDSGEGILHSSRYLAPGYPAAIPAIVLQFGGGADSGLLDLSLTQHCRRCRHTKA